MDGYDLQQYLYCVEKANCFNIVLKPKEDKIELINIDEVSFGIFRTVWDCYNYLCGYEVGISHGKYL